MNSSENALVKMAIKGDKAAFSKLIISYESTLYGTAVNIVKDNEDAKDCVQDAIISGYENILKLKNPKYFKTWIIRILINQCISFLREKNKTVNLEYIDENISGIDKDYDNYLDVQGALAALNKNEQLILSLYYIEDLSVKDIASLLSLSESAVKQRLSRSRNSFKSVYNKACGNDT